MSITKITKNAFPASIDLSSVDLTIGNDEIVTANIADNNVTHAKLHTDMDLSSKTVVLPTLNTPLTVLGNGNATLQWGDDTAIGALSFDINDNPLIRSYSGKDLFFQTNGGNNRMVIESGGNIGIGTDNPNTKVQIGNGVEASNRLRFLVPNLESLGAGIQFYVASTEYFNIDYNSDTNKLLFNTDTTFSSNIHLMSLDRENRRVGIGTSSPDKTMNIHGDAEDIGNIHTVLAVQDERAYNSTRPGGGISFRAKYNSSGAHTNMAAIQGIKENTTDGNYSSAMLFTTRTNGATMTEKMRISSDGNVGIGTTDPTNVKLQQNKSGSDTVGDGHIGLGGGSTPLWAIRGGSLDFDLRIDRSYAGWQSTPALSIRRMNGNVGIGLDTASTKLHVKSGGAGNSYGSLYLEIDTATNYPAMVIQTATGGNTTETHGLYIKNTAAGFGLRVDDAAGDTSPFIVDAAGNVAIGDDAAPSAKLYVRKDATTYANIATSTYGHKFEAQPNANTDGFEIYQQHGYNDTRHSFIVANNSPGSKQTAFAIRDDNKLYGGSGTQYYHIPKVYGFRYGANSSGSHWYRVAYLPARSPLEVVIGTTGGYYSPGATTIHVMRDWNTTNLGVATVSKVDAQYVTQVRLQSDNGGGHWYLEVYFNGVNSNQLSDFMQIAIRPMGHSALESALTNNILLNNFGQDASNLTYTSGTYTL